MKLLLIAMILPATVSSMRGQDNSPSLDDTLSFIKSRLDGTSGTRVWEHQSGRCSALLSMSTSFDMLQFTSSSASIRATQTISEQMLTENCSGGRKPSTIGMITTFPLAAIAISSSNVGPCPRDAVPLPEKTSYYCLNLVFNHMSDTTIKGTTAGNGIVGLTTEGNGVSFLFQDKVLADRLLRAFQHAAELCGSKKEPF